MLLEIFYSDAHSKMFFDLLFFTMAFVAVLPLVQYGLHRDYEEQKERKNKPIIINGKYRRVK